MGNRALKAVLLSAGVSGMFYLVVSGVSGGSGEPAPSAWVVPGRTAYAQSPADQLRYSVVTVRSEVRYRVREQLVGLSFPNDAVGATSAIRGSVSVDAQGRVLPTDSRFTVDLRTLRSDEPRRDNYVRRNTLETDRFPTAVFAPAEIRGLRLPLPQTGTASCEIVGELTVRDTSRHIIWEATATLNGQDISVRARTALRFADFGLRVPRVAVVLSVEDTIRLEADLLLRRSS